MISDAMNPRNLIMAWNGVGLGFFVFGLSFRIPLLTLTSLALALSYFEVVGACPPNWTVNSC